MVRTAALALFAAVCGGSAQAQSTDELWSRYQSEMEASGINRDAFEALTLWMEGQSLLGYCDAHLRPHNVIFYRDWWQGKPISNTDFGREMIARGHEVYERGYRDGLAERPSAELCARTVDSWLDDLRATLDKIR